MSTYSFLGLLSNVINFLRNIFDELDEILEETIKGNSTDNINNLVGILRNVATTEKEKEEALLLIDTAKG